jgi:hypothetical protein
MPSYIPSALEPDGSKKTNRYYHPRGYVIGFSSLCFER